MLIETRTIMGMPCTLQLANEASSNIKIFEKVFAYLTYVDQTFSTYKPDSEISQINASSLRAKDASRDVQEVLELSEQTKQQTDGYFDIRLPDGTIDPSGLVKGWAIHNAANLVRQAGVSNFLVEVAGDMEAVGNGPEDKGWKLGIRNPFDITKIIKVVCLSDRGIATSGTYLQGTHIYNPTSGKSANDIASLTVVGPNAYEADRFATAAFAMGHDGIKFIAKRPGLEGYMVDRKGIATYTSGFGHYVE